MNPVPGAKQVTDAKQVPGAKQATRAKRATRAKQLARARQFNPERLLTVLLAPVVSEKTTFVGEKANQYVFRVAPDATKPEIKAAVELLFSSKDKKIQVTGVRVANVRGKHKRFGRMPGRRSNWKKAYVSLAAGQDIAFQPME
jgi:large subunit ribosomal protein L23